MTTTTRAPARLEPAPAARSLARRRRLTVVGLLVVTVVVGVVSIGFGAEHLGVNRVLVALMGHGTVSEELIVRQFRLPRIIAGACVGASLAVSGVLLQAVTRNPIASPAVVGINGGAGFGAVLMVSYAGATASWSTPAGAFVGAVATGTAVYLLSRRHGVVNPGRLALVGVAIGGLAMAAIQLVLVLTVFTGDIDIALRWLIGSLWNTSWMNVWQVLPFTVVLLPVAWLLAGQLDLLGLGEDVPRALGARLETLKLVVLAVAVSLAASAVAVGGTIAFVGLVSPHICRRLVGPGHRLLVPAAALSGALLVLVADAAGRSLLPPLEIPVGLFTAVIGAPYFLTQLRRGLGRA